MRLMQRNIVPICLSMTWKARSCRLGRGTKGDRRMDYKELVTRIDEMGMSARDRAAAKAQLAHAERAVDWAFAVAGRVRGATNTLIGSVRPIMAKVRTSSPRAHRA